MNPGNSISDPHPRAIHKPVTLYLMYADVHCIIACATHMRGRKCAGKKACLVFCACSGADSVNAEMSSVQSLFLPRAG